MSALNESAATTGPAPAAEERPDGYARRALAAAAVGYAMDGFDLLILGFIMSAVAAELHLSAAAGASLATWTLVGAVAGGVLFGALSDRIGRVRVLTWTILLFAVFTGLSALARGYWDLVLYRTVAGLGLGGEFGIGMALAAEAWPPSRRARVCSYVGLGWQAGVLAAALLTPLLLPQIGWRGVFAIGIVPAFVSFAVRRSVGEPPLFLAHRAAAEGRGGSGGGRGALPLGLLVRDRATARISLGVFILCAVQNFGYFGMMIWLPNYLASRFGYSLTKSGLWVAVTVLGMGFGIWLFGQLADRIGRRPVFFAFQAGALVMVLVYSQLTGELALLFGGALLGVFVNGMLGGYGALIAELYPTEARATAQNVLFNLGRAVGGFGPLVLGLIGQHYSFATAIALLAFLYGLDILATALFIPERRGAALT